MQIRLIILYHYIEIYNSKSRIMDGPRIGSDHYNGIGHRRKKIQIFSTNKGEPIKRQQYYDSNPYSLHHSPTTPVLQRTATTPDSLSNRDNFTETSSQKSGKLVRTNGLSRAEKPNIGQSRASNKQIVHKMSGSRIGPAFSAGYPQDPHIPTIKQQYGLPIYERPFQPTLLSEQNNALREQNRRLKQQIIRIERNHNDQINTLKQQLDRVFKLVHDLEQKMKISDKQWESYCKDNR